MAQVIDNFKVKFNERNHDPPFKPAADHLNHACRITHNLPSDPREKNSLIPGEGGKHHFPTIYSDTESFRPARKYIERPEYGKEYSSPKKKLAPRPAPKEAREEGCKHFPDEYTKATETTDALCVGWQSRRRLPPAGSKEYNMETYMNRKQRIGSLEEQRNGIPCANQGDKFYKSPEYMPGYCAAGGLIPGSSIVARKSAKPEPKKKVESESGTKQETKKKSTLTYAEKVKLLEKKYDMDQIKFLNNKSTKLGQDVPSWEERTGQFIVKPEDEKD